MTLGNTLVYLGTTYTKNTDTGYYTSPDDDGGIIDSNGNYFDTASGEFVVNVANGSTTPSTGSTLGDLWNNITQTVTSPTTIKGVVNKLIGLNVLPSSATTSTPKIVPPPKKDNTILYVVLGIAVVGLGIFAYKKMKK